jgi:hypothetical protein
MLIPFSRGIARLITDAYQNGVCEGILFTQKAFETVSSSSSFFPVFLMIVVPLEDLEYFAMQQKDLQLELFSIPPQNPFTYPEQGENRYKMPYCSRNTKFATCILCNKSNIQLTLAVLKKWLRMPPPRKKLEVKKCWLMRLLRKA